MTLFSKDNPRRSLLIASLLFLVLSAGTALVVYKPTVHSPAEATENVIIDRRSPVAQIVAHIDSLALEGDWEALDRFVDYKTKGKNLVPDLWESANQEARDALIVLLKENFQRSWKKIHETEGFQNAKLRTEKPSEKKRSVVQEAILKPGGTVAFVYEFHLTKQGWMIVDRTVKTGQRMLKPDGKVRVIRKQLRQQLGREPTLREFVDNAPSWLGRIKERRFTVPGK